MTRSYPQFRIERHNGRPFWRHVASGRLLPFVSGGADDSDGGQGGGDTGEGTFSQEQVDRIAGRARVEAKRAAEKELADTLGCSVDEAKELIDAKRTADENAMSEADKARAAAKAAETEAEQARADAAADRLLAKVERRLTRAGVTDAAMDRVIAMVDLDADADDEAIDAEIEAIRTDLPSLFADTGSDKKRKPAPSSTPAGKPPATGATTSSLERGRELARKKFPPANNQQPQPAV